MSKLTIIINYGSEEVNKTAFKSHCPSPSKTAKNNSWQIYLILFCAVAERRKSDSYMLQKCLKNYA